MAAESHSRHITFESVRNFRDLGGYQTQDGYSVVWRRLFRSGDLRRISRSDLTRLREEIGLTSVIDLRSSIEAKEQGIEILSEVGIRYHSVPFITRSGDSNREREMFREFSNMGEVYLSLARDKEFSRRVVEALEIIAEPENHPLVFHCFVGKDRTGILAAIVLSILGVADADIIEDYTLTAPYMEELIKSMNNNPEIAEGVKHLPGYFWKAAPESMALFLSTLQREYGSVRGYVEAQGAEASLPRRLKRSLLT